MSNNLLSAVKLSVHLEDALTSMAEKGVDQKDIAAVEAAREKVIEFENAANVLAHLAFISGTPL